MTDVAELLRSTLAYAQDLGCHLVARVQGDMLIIGIPGLTITDGHIVAIDNNVPPNGVPPNDV